MSRRDDSDPLAPFHPAVRAWFAAEFAGPTRPQTLGWPAIARGESTLILAPTGSGKTLAAFLWCLDRLMFTPAPAKARRCRVLYVSPLKALAVDVERNLRAPLAGIARVADERGEPYTAPAIAIRTGDTPPADRARFQRTPADILITTPESLYLLLTSNARDALRAVDTIIIDEIHALVPTKRGAHLAVSIERLAALCERCAAADRPVGDPTAARRGRALSRRCRNAGGRSSGPGPLRARPAGGSGSAHIRFARRSARDRRRVRGLPRRRSISPDHHHRHGRTEGAQAHDRGAGRGHGAADAGTTMCPAVRRRPATRAPRSGRRSTPGCWS